MAGASHTERFGYKKGMTKGGVDIDRVFDEHSARSKEIYADAINGADKENIPQMGFVVAQFAKKTAFTTLAMVKDLEERIAAIEDRGIRYRGLWTSADEYQRGDLVTFAGSMFHALRDSYADPPFADGTKSSAWMLVVQRGKNGKDAGR